MNGRNTELTWRMQVRTGALSARIFTFLALSCAACNALLGIDEPTRQRTVVQLDASVMSSDAGQDSGNVEEAGLATGTPAEDPGSADAGDAQVATSSPECEEGDAKCDGPVRMLCLDGVFQEVETCRMACRAEGCVPDCDDRDDGMGSLCRDADTLDSCEEGQNKETKCEFGCREDHCLACLPDTVECRNDLQRSVCDSEGEEAIELCDFACTQEGCSDGLLCPQMTECGGYPVGHWTVRNSCLPETELSMDAGAGYPPNCALSLRFVEQQIVGTLDLSADLSGALNGALTQKYVFRVTPECQLQWTVEFCNQFTALFVANTDRENLCQVADDGLGCDCISMGTVSVSGHELQGAFQQGSFCATDARLRFALGTVVSLERVRSLFYVKPGTPQAEARFGAAVAVAPNELVVGAPQEDGGRGAVYVFERNQPSQDWRQRTRLTSPEPAANDSFGVTVAISGDRLIVGSSNTDRVADGASERVVPDAGAVYVYIRADGGWSLESTLQAPVPQEIERFGLSVAIEGERIVVGAPNNSRHAPIAVEDPDSDAGASAAKSGIEHSGSVYVFSRVGGTWLLEQELKASSPDSADYFGCAVAIAGDTLVAGATGEDGADSDQQDNGAQNSGAVYVFERNTTGWEQRAYLKADNLAPGDKFGRSVALSGNIIGVGAPGKTLETGAGMSLPLAGAAYVFERVEGGWVQRAFLTEPQPGPNHGFGGPDGQGVVIHGDAISIAAPLSNSPGTGFNPAPEGRPVNSSGAVQTFVRAGDGWRHYAALKANNTGDLDVFGTSVAARDAMIVVGAPQEDSASQDPLDNTFNSAGAVYVFE